MNLPRLLKILETTQRAWDAGRFPDEKYSFGQDVAAALAEVRALQEGAEQSSPDPAWSHFCPNGLVWRTYPSLLCSLCHVGMAPHPRRDPL